MKKPAREMRYAEVRHDAGLFRKWIAANYGKHLTNHDGSETARTARRLVLELAFLTGFRPKLVHGWLLADWDQLEAEVKAGWLRDQLETADASIGGGR